MSEVGLLIESSMNDAVSGLKKPVVMSNDGAPAFSFASAVSALEGRAAQSLEMHGAAPQNANVGKHSGKTPSDTSNANTRTQTQHSPAQTNQTSASNSTPAPQSPAATTPQTLPAPAVAQLVQPLVQAAATAPQAAAATVGLSAPAAKADAALPPTIETRAPATSKLARPETAHKAPPTVQDFAKLIARRLDSGVSVFELRLDPPALGRVEAQMKVADNGEAKLSLTFDSQTALDMFSRDETDLRQSLTDSGFDLGRDHLELLLKDDAARSFETGDAAVAPTETYASLGYSQGVIDLTI